MTANCGVCEREFWKYKCPVCMLKYCSINCYKSHKVIHEDGETRIATESSGHAHTKRDRPGTTQRTEKRDFTGFENDEDFERLLSRYPLLSVQLQVVYGLTLEPGPDEARSWNRRPLPGLQESPHYLRGRDRGRGRADRGFRNQRGGRGSGRGSFDVASNDRPQGPWTQEKGDKEALKMIKQMRESDVNGGDDEMAEGMREFVDLCRIKFGQ